MEPMRLRRLVPLLVLLASLAFAGEPGASATPPSVWPLTGTATPHKVNSPFGPRIRASLGVYEFHPGVDFQADVGTNVYAAGGGTIRLMTDDNGCTITTANATVTPTCSSPTYPNGGRIVQIDHGGKVYTNYLHLSQQTAGLKTGDAVAASQLIGKTGQTGTTDFPHLHFEVRAGSFLSGDVKNPLGYLPWTGDVATTIQAVSIVARTGGRSVKVDLQATPDDLNLDQVSVAVRAADGTAVAETAQTRVAFNDKVNCGGATNPMNGVTLTPASFNRDTALYQLTVEFAGLTLPSGGSVAVTATDVSGLSSSSTAPIP